MNICIIYLYLEVDFVVIFFGNFGVTEWLAYSPLAIFFINCVVRVSSQGGIYDWRAVS